MCDPLDMKKYRVTLTVTERKFLRTQIESGVASREKLNRAWMLLSLDQAGASPQLSDTEVAQSFGVSIRTVENLRKRFVLEGFELSLNGKRRGSRPDRVKIDGKLEAKVIALSCCKAPAGYARWSLRLLADRLVELNHVDSISHESVRQVLKKRASAAQA